MTDIREVIESPLSQGKDEKIPYRLTTTPWGGGPSDVTVKVYDTTRGNYTDVSDTCLSGAPVVAGDVITLPKLQALEAGHTYRLEVAFTSQGNELEAYAVIAAAN